MAFYNGQGGWVNEGWVLVLSDFHTSKNVLAVPAGMFKVVAVPFHPLAGNTAATNLYKVHIYLHVS
jgi:hypothetical protein